MKQNSTTITEGPLHILLRRRRKELSLYQTQIAAALHVSPECVGQWECGRRRMELSKLPRIAEALQLNAKELCAKALLDFTLWSMMPCSAMTPLPPTSSRCRYRAAALYALRDSIGSAAARKRSKSLLAAWESSKSLPSRSSVPENAMCRWPASRATPGGRSASFQRNTSG
jgi:transcriptional regulator with XRE-family HTH domain